MVQFFIQRRTLCSPLVLVALVAFSPAASSAWEWSDLVSGGWGSTAATPPDTLSMEEVSAMRARDIKWRLARTHGYSAEELSKMLDKKELVQALSSEEEKVRLTAEADVKRALAKQGILAAVAAVALVMLWPLIHRAYQVASVNLVVYWDKKCFEAKRCWQLKSKQAMVGIFLMGVLDVLQVWLSASVLLSWVMTSKYFFPVPRLPIRPGQLMGGEVAKSSLAGFGVNIGPMVIGWLLRFLHVRVERFTGQAMAWAYGTQRRAVRAAESEQERGARKAAKRERKRRKQQQDAEAAALRELAAMAQPGPSTQLRTDWMHPTAEAETSSTRQQSAPPSSRTHEEFLEQIDIYTPELDDLD